MKRLIIVTFILLIFVFDSLQAQKPEKIYSIAWVYKTHDYYVEQAKEWWNLIDKDKSNADAWYNYYKANRYAKMTATDENGVPWRERTKWVDESEILMELSDVEAEIKEHVPESFAYYSIKYWNNENVFTDQNSKNLLDKAYYLNPNNIDIWDKSVVYYDIKRELKKRKEINEIWFNSNEFSPGMLNYHYNVLMTLKENAIILTYGDSPTMTIWMLQDALNIRTDVNVFCVSLLHIDKYREELFKKFNIPELKYDNEDITRDKTQKVINHILDNKPKEFPLYVSLQLWEQDESYKDNLYLVGLALEYSHEEIDNIAFLKKNFEQKYVLDYLKINFQNDKGIKLVNYDNFNYFPGIVKLYNHYKVSGEIEKAEKMKKLGIIIADKLTEEYKQIANEAFK